MWAPTMGCGQWDRRWSSRVAGELAATDTWALGKRGAQTVCFHGKVLLETSPGEGEPCGRGREGFLCSPEAL